LYSLPVNYVLDINLESPVHAEPVGVNCRVCVPCSWCQPVCPTSGHLSRCTGQVATLFALHFIKTKL